MTNEEQLHHARHALLAIHALATRALASVDAGSRSESDLKTIIGMADGGLTSPVAEPSSDDPEVK